MSEQQKKSLKVKDRKKSERGLMYRFFFISSPILVLCVLGVVLLTNVTGSHLSPFLLLPFGLLMLWLFGRTWAKQRAVELREIRLKSLFKLINKTLRHDISGKLTTVRYGIETSEVEENEGIDMAYQAAADGIELVRQMKVLEKLAEDNVDLLPVDIRGEIESAAKGYSIPLHIHGNAMILADPALRSVFENLIRNAVVHSGTDKIHVEISVLDGYVEVQVIDFGKGIPEKHRKTLFTEGGKFGDTGNTGLGLYIVKETIERYGGSVRFEATKPHGATFVLTLKKAEKN